MLPRANPAVIFQRVDDGAVLFAPASELYFGLNEVGAAIWESLPPVATSLDDLCARVQARYPDAPAETIRADALELLEQLVGDGLALRPGTGTADGAAAP